MNTALVVPALVATATGMQQVDSGQMLDEIARLREQNARIAASNAELAEKVARLEEHAARDGTWLTEERAREIRAIVSDVLADSSVRSSLLADGSTAGWDKSKGFHLASADGAYTMSIHGEIQVRFNQNHRDIGTAPAAAGSPSELTDDDTHGFELRRTRFDFSGNLIDPSWSYLIRFAANRTATSGSNGYLEDAWVQKKLDGGFALKVGQFKAPFMREELQSAFGQETVERSLVNGVFTAARTQGVSLIWSDDNLRFEVMYSDALQASATAPYALSGSNAVALNAGASQGIANSVNTGFSTNPSDYAFAGRAEWKPEGEWAQFKDAQSFVGEQRGVLVGVAGYAQAFPLLPGATTATPESIWAATTDLTIEFGGASFFVAGVYRGVELQDPQAVRGGGTEDSLGQWGAVVQGGLFATDNTELFCRYEVGNTDTDQFRTEATSTLATGEENSIVTLGVNWWPEGYKVRNIKLSADFGYAFTPIIDFAGNGAAYLVDYTAANGDSNDGQFVFRSQLQFTF